MPEGIFHCLKIFSLYSQTAQHSISMDLNFIMVQLVALYYAVTAGYKTVLFAKQGIRDSYSVIDQSNEAALFINLSFLTNDVFPPHRYVMLTLTILQDTKILVSMTTGTIH